MTEQTNAELIAASETWTPAEVHASPVGAARIIESLAAALETAEKRAEEAEREHDRLDEAFDRDLPWRYDEVEAQRNQLAAVVEKVRAWADEAIGYGEPSGDTVSDLLATTPADALREVKAEAWQEGAYRVYNSTLDEAEWWWSDWASENPYKAREEKR